LVGSCCCGCAGGRVRRGGREGGRGVSSFFKIPKAIGRLLLLWVRWGEGKAGREGGREGGVVVLISDFILMKTIIPSLPPSLPPSLRFGLQGGGDH